MHARSSEFDLDYQALNVGMGYAPLPRTQIELTGADRASFLHNLCTNDLRKLPNGSGCEAMFLNAQGKILSFVRLFAEAERLVLDTVPGRSEFLLKYLDRYLMREQVVLTDRSNAWAVLIVAGPQSAELLHKLCGGAPPVGLLQHAAVQIAGCAATLEHVDFTGTDCYFVRCASGDLPTIEAALATSGGRACAPEAIEAARIEHGTPLFGIDISEKNLPQELGRDQRAISFTKGCYIGQETVARIDALGHVNRLLRGVRFDPAAPARVGDAIEADGLNIGEVTSLAWSPKLQSPLGLAYIKRSHASSGTQATCGGFPAAIVELPVR